MRKLWNRELCMPFLSETKIIFEGQNEHFRFELVIPIWISEWLSSMNEFGFSYSWKR